MIVITGSVRVDAASMAQTLALGVEHSARSRGEAGCIAHNCHVDAEDPERIVFVEQWVDMAAVQAHFAVPESGRFVAAIAQLALEPPQMQIYEARELPHRILV